MSLGHGRRGRGGSFGWCCGPLAVWCAGESPSSFVDTAVVSPAEENEVVQVGGAAPGPRDDVVRVGPWWRAVAVGPGAAAVSDGERGPYCGWDGAGAAADVQWLAGAVGDDAGDDGVAGQPAGGLG